MIDFNQIHEAFGPPITPRSQSSIKPWHIVVGGAVLMLAVYGAVKLHENYFPIPKIKKRDYDA